MNCQQTSEPWKNWNFQLNAYVSWVNSQLRKSKKSSLIKDLRQDMKDGVILADLLQILDGNTVPGLRLHPESYLSMKENIENVLDFMTKRNIQFPHSVTAKDIVEGNIKSVMRLIQSIAAHYKPACISKQDTNLSANEAQIDAEVKVEASQRSYSSRNNTENYNTLPRSKDSKKYDAYLCDQRVNSDHYHSEQENRRKNEFVFEPPDIGTRRDDSCSPPLYENWPGEENESDKFPNCTERHVDGASYTGSPCSSVVRGPTVKMNGTLEHVSRTFVSTRLRLIINNLCNFESALEKFRISQKKSIRSRILSKSSDEKELTCLMDQLRLLNKDLFRLNNDVLDKKELQTLEQSTQVSDIGESFPSNEEMREMKNCLEKEIGNHDITKEECKILIKQAEKFKDTNRELSKKLEIKEDDIMKMQIELNNKDQIIKRQRSQFDETLKNLNAANKTKTNLTNRIAEQDKKIARLELNVGSSSSPSPGKQQTREEIRIVRDALHSLRGSFNSNNSQQHTIDTIEQSIATLMERLHSAEMQLHTTHQNLIPEDEETQSLNYDSTGDPNRSPITSLHNFRKKSEENVEDIDGWTKCVYFTERAVTPYLFHIPKRIGEIRLKDFKEYFDRPGPYRYHFKALDPEFGMVKEEVVNDSDVLPGLDGKVIAWVEEDV